MLRSVLYRLSLRLDGVLRPESREAFRTLRAGEAANCEGLRAMRDDAFRRLARHAYDHVPYYRELMDAADIDPSSVSGLDDLPRFPALRKETVRERGAELRARNIPPGELIGKRTGGTTSGPVEACVDRRGWLFEKHAYLRGLEWMGWRPGMKTVRLFGGTLGRPAGWTVRSKVRAYATGDVFLPAFEVCPSNVRRYAEVISRSGPSVVVGYASAVLQLADLALRGSVRFDGVQTVMCTAEALPPAWLATIGEAFRCPVKSFYGCGEVNSVGFQVVEDGPYVVSDEHVVVEEGEGDGSGPKPLLLTTLYNWGHPFIRYAVNDLGFVDPPGVGHPARTSIREIHGRVDDMFVTREGARISGALGPHMMLVTRLPVRQYQFIQWTADRIEFRHTPSARSLTSDERDEVRQILRRCVAPTIEVEFQESEEFIVSPSGKHRVVVCNVNRGGDGSIPPAQVDVAPASC